MAQYIAVRALNRSAQIRVVDSTGAKVKLTTTVDTVINLDLATNVRALENHATFGQWIVSAANASANANVALPSNS